MYIYIYTYKSDIGNKFDSTECQYPRTIYINRIQEGINNLNRLIASVLSTTKILKTYPQCFKYKILFFKWTIQ